ncbi:hypothetical protein ACFO5U_08305 [Planococcus dechangensis]|uniref:Transposase n=1 Tax=Planococcus dechangensis TaxID=1176255 RepID=A0ABV9MAG9_9BACL
MQALRQGKAGSVHRLMNKKPGICIPGFSTVKNRVLRRLLKHSFNWIEPFK